MAISLTISWLISTCWSISCSAIHLLGKEGHFEMNLIRVLLNEVFFLRKILAWISGNHADSFHEAKSVDQLAPSWRFAERRFFHWWAVYSAPSVGQFASGEESITSSADASPSLKLLALSRSDYFDPLIWAISRWLSLPFQRWLYP